MRRRVAITGLGAIAATGADIPSVWAAIRAGICGIGPIAELPTERLLVRVAAQIHGFQPQTQFEPKHLALLDRATQLALVAAREAVRDAALDTHALGARAGDTAAQFHRRLRRALLPQMRVAGALAAVGARPQGQALMLAATRLWPGLLRVIARRTRVPEAPAT